MTPNEYQKEALKLALPKCRNLNYMIHGLTNEAGEVAGKYKKVLREDMTLDDAEVGLIKELGDVAWYLAGAAAMLNIDLEYVLEKNLEKLKGRHATGTIQGNGDDR